MKRTKLKTAVRNIGKTVNDIMKALNSDENDKDVKNYIVEELNRLLERASSAAEIAVGGNEWDDEFEISFYTAEGDDIYSSVIGSRQIVVDLKKESLVIKNGSLTFEKVG